MSISFKNLQRLLCSFHTKRQLLDDAFGIETIYSLLVGQRMNDDWKDVIVT
jgi:hypothetical protein